MEADQGT